MIGGVNGANVNLYSGFQNIKEQSTSRSKPSTDENSLNFSSQKTSQKHQSDKFKSHKREQI